MRERIPWSFLAASALLLAAALCIGCAGGPAPSAQSDQGSTERPPRREVEELASRTGGQSEDIFDSFLSTDDGGRVDADPGAPVAQPEETLLAGDRRRGRRGGEPHDAPRARPEPLPDLGLAQGSAAGSAPTPEQTGPWTLGKPVRKPAAKPRR